MQRLVQILLLFKEYFVLVVLIIISLILLSSNDNVQIRAIRSYTVEFVGIFQNAISVIPNVFELKRDNELLRKLSVNLSDEVNRLREARLENIRLRAMLRMKERSEFKLVACDIIGKSLHLFRNTITINVGESGGIKVNMPIISETGLVGKVIATSNHHSICQLVLNQDFRASAKVLRTRIDGIISWSGCETVQLKNVTKTQDVKEGDIVTTSEYSNIFPPDIKIGFISKVVEIQGSLFKDISVTPSVDFSSLEQVFVVIAAIDSERVELDQKVLHLK